MRDSELDHRLNNGCEQPLQKTYWDFTDCLPAADDGCTKFASPVFPPPRLYAWRPVFAVHGPAVITQISLRRTPLYGTLGRAIRVRLLRNLTNFLFS